MKTYTVFTPIIAVYLAIFSLSSIAAEWVDDTFAPAESFSIGEKFKATLKEIHKPDNTVEEFLTSFSLSQGVKYMVSTEEQLEVYRNLSYNDAYSFKSTALLGWLNPDADLEDLLTTPAVAGSAVGLAAYYFLKQQNTLSPVYVIPLFSEDNYGLQLMTRF